MFRRTFAWATVAVVSSALLGDPHPNVAGVQQTAVVEGASAVLVTSSDLPESDVLELASLRAPAEPDLSAAAPQAVQPAPPPVEAAPIVAVARVAAPVVAPPPPATCPSGWLCYPRVGIAGPIVPYNDCSAATDVGTAIRSITCVSPTYLAAHAYTQFGRITGWQAGDVVFAYGVRYTIFDGFTQSSCVAPARAIAPLSLQTSLSSTKCGPVLVLQARPG